jgi:hypothetical protein
MGLYKRFTAFIILFLLVSTFAVAMHHHEDTADDHHDCPICLVSHHQQATSQPIIAFDATPFITETAFASPASDLIEQIVISLLKNRAPPA